MSSQSIFIGLTGLAGAGKDTVADALVTHAGFTKLAFADALRQEVAQAYEMGADHTVLSIRASKETPHDHLAFGWCTDLQFIAAINAARFGGAMQLHELDEPRSPRQILQWWGTEYRRAQDPNYWVARAFDAAAHLQLNGQRRIVFTDCRFENEAAALRAVGGEVWQVFRPGLRPVEGGHASQTTGDALKPERFIVNSSTIADTAKQALRVLIKRHGGAVLPIHLREPLAP